jgi:ribosomal protein L23
LGTQFIAGYRAIKAQILEAVNETYYISVLDANNTTMGTSPKKILRHLQHTYGKFTVQELDTNRAKLQESRDGQGSIAVVFNRIKAVRDVAHAGKMPISDNECTIALLNILETITDFKTAVLAQCICKMHKWNWKETVREFTLVDQERINNTLAASGYHQMNAADGKPIAKKQMEGPREQKGPPTGKFIMDVSNTTVKRVRTNKRVTWTAPPDETK